MTLAVLDDDIFPGSFYAGAVRTILDLQQGDGAIPWHDGGVFDAWNHVEAAMGLAVAGHAEAARRAFLYLAETQERDGSWWGTYHGDTSGKKIRDTNFCAYIATGIWHSYLLTGDRTVLAEFWPVVAGALGFVLSLQTDDGDIRWAARDAHTQEDDALIAGCASIYKSLECGILIADALGKPSRDWQLARARLGDALRMKPERFDRTWPSKSNFSMSWYYPVLAGVLRGRDARHHLAARWRDFVAEGFGCRCVQEQPWVTVAEGAELAIALTAAGQRAQAFEMLRWQHQWRATDGAYWMGYQFETNAHWPREKPAWTAAAVLLAADALSGTTPAARLFTEVAVADSAI